MGSRKRSERALQVWQILIPAANNRQTLTYKMVANYLEFRGAGILSQILGRIMHYCERENLPPLTCIVVNQETGEPGNGLTTIDNLMKDRENVYNLNWFALMPPTLEELSQN